MKKILSITIIAAIITLICFLFTFRTTSVPENSADSNEIAIIEFDTEQISLNPSKEIEESENTEQIAQTQKVSDTETLSLEEIKQLPAHSIVDTASLSDDEIDELFYATEITDAIFSRINNKSYTENDKITIEQLSYIRVLHIGFDENTYIGELIVNNKISDDILEIMRELYSEAYLIESMVLVDEYGADDNKSMEANNTSSFNYRTVPGSNNISNHSYGLAIDINPLYNPYVRTKNGELNILPANGSEYVDRSGGFPYKIDHDDICYKLFIQHGFTWGGDWKNSKDYQHFEKT